MPICSPHNLFKTMKLPILISLFIWAPTKAATPLWTRAGPLRLSIFIAIDERGEKGADEFYKKFRVKDWIHSDHDLEMPVVTPSPDVSVHAGSNAYEKPSLSYIALKDLLGDELFKKALLTYMDNWNGKHPIPWDYFNSIKNASGQNLDWFFYNWFYTPYYIDIALEKVSKAPDGYTLSVKNIGGFAIPFDVNVTYADGSTGTFHQTPIVWEHNQAAIKVKIATSKLVTATTLDGGIFMDADTSNNTWKK